jgi:hypothetical protein
MDVTESVRLERAAVDGRDGIRIHGLPAALLERLRGWGERDLALAFPFHVDPDGPTPRAQPRPAVPGRYRVEPTCVVFAPRFPWLAGTAYRLRIHPGLAAAREPGALPEPSVQAPVLDRPQLRVERPRPDVAGRTFVQAVHPRADELPCNQLKLYVTFSGPMSEGCAWRHLSLVRVDDGSTLASPFVELDPELWDPERRRLTVLFDPGRLKRGLAPNRSDGPPLRSGVAVRLVIAREFPDADGFALRESFFREYRVGPELRRRVRPEEWSLQAPDAGSRRPLVLRFDRSLDHALLQHCIRVLDADGKPLAGDAEVGNAERDWRFVPHESWRAARHVVRVDACLEDLAGNSLARVFDRDLGREGDAPADPVAAALAFVPQQPGSG